MVRDLDLQFHPPLNQLRAQKVAKKPGRGIRLTSQTKYIIENVRRFFEEEKKAKRSTLRDRVVDRTAKDQMDF